jgi:tRNA dimethylallyltransferase
LDVPDKPKEKVPLLVVAGPTAGGKTALATALCERLCGEVVSADSMQIYKGMDIATAKPGPEELTRAPHHLISVLEPWARCSVAHYAPLAHAAIAHIHARGKLPILCGGTGLYLQAVTENLQYTPQKTDMAARLCIAPDWQRLHKIDPTAAAKIHPNDAKRIVRALELYAVAGVTRTQQDANSRWQVSPYRAKLLVLQPRDRQALYRRIDARVEAMLQAGLPEEAAQWRRKMGATAAQAIGHKELEPYFADTATLEACVDKLKMETRRYAKRQLSWFRRMAFEWNERVPGSCGVLWIEDTDLPEQAVAFWKGSSPVAPARDLTRQGSAL